MQVDLPDQAGWQRALESLPAYSFFATPRFVNAWIRHFDPTARARVARIRHAGGGWRLAAFVESRISRLGTLALVGVPDGGYGVVGAGPMPPEWLAAMCSVLGTSRVETIELTIGPGLQEGEPRGVWHAEQTAWMIDTHEGFDAWWNGCLDKRVRRQITRSEEEGVRTRACGVEGLDAFFAMYEQSLRANPKRTHSYPKAFLRDLIDGRGPGEASLYLTYRGDCVIAGGLLLRGGSEALAWIGAMDRSQGAVYGNENRHTSVLRDLVASGARRYNLGAAPALPEVAAFKRKLGAQPVPYHIVRWQSPLWARLRTWQGRQQ
ncbi:MAG: GNAT family N-acetyltransferase [Burkholderiales bacterium]|nr:GNAT family N-acetyltransferase [Burkholderiales bacterium]